MLAKIPFFDLQVNGYAGIDFNQDDLSAEGLHKACLALERDGVAAILATFITDHIPTMCHRIAALVRLRDADPLAKRLIPGLHIEGPFISPIDGYRGAHPKDAVIAATIDQTQKLLDAGNGLIKLITLAPEADESSAVTRFLAKQKILVSAGHTNATLDQLKSAIDSGLCMFTHLGNACPQLMSRHDNIIQRGLSVADRIWTCFIADGAHVPFVALGNYLRITPPDRTIIVTDAVAPAGLGPGRYTLGRWDVKVGEDLVARAPDGSHLLGSAVTMIQSAHRLRQHLALSDSQIELLTASNPRKAVGFLS